MPLAVVRTLFKKKRETNRCFCLSAYSCGCWAYRSCGWMKSVQNNLGWHDCAMVKALRRFNECIQRRRITKGKGHETRPIQFCLRKRKICSWCYYMQWAAETATDSIVTGYWQSLLRCMKRTTTDWSFYSTVSNRV